MLTTIIYSKNRACQLDLLLRSMRANLPKLQSDIHVLYKYTDDNFRLGYELIAKKFPYITLHKEEDFEKDSYKLINLTPKYVLFLADDNVFYRHSNITIDIIDDTFTNTEFPCCCFSLRLGFNTVLQDPSTQQLTQIPSNFYVKELNDVTLLLWEWRKCHRYHNFGYPFAMDAHIYNKKRVLEGLNFEFHNTTQLEGTYCQHVEHFDQYMCSLDQSVSVNNPTNRVSESGLVAGQVYNFSLENLNEKFLDNFVVNLNSIMETNVVGCHQEIDLQFIQEA